MPIYEYVCASCEVKFEKLVRRWGEDVECPGCQSHSVDKQLSTFAVASSPGSSDAFVGCARNDGGCEAPACGSGGCGVAN